MFWLRGVAVCRGANRWQLAAAMRVPEVVGWSWWSDPVIELDPPMLIGGLINDPY